MENKKKAWNILWAVLAVGVFYLTGNLLSLLGYVAIPKWIIPVKPEQANSYMFTADLIISVVLLALSFFAYKKLHGKTAEEKTPVFEKTLVKCIVMGIAVFGVNSLLDMIFKPSAGAGAKESLISMFITGVVFAPLIEEFFFRGVVYNFLNRFKSGWFSVLLSAAIFGAYHMDFYQAVYTAVLGIVLALVYQRTKNILYPIAVHMTNNAFACLMASEIPESMQTVLGIGAVAMMIPAAVLLIKNRTSLAPKISSDENR